MTNMIAEYFKESQRYETLEEPNKGFIMFSKAGDELHLAHLYIRPDFRRSGLGQDLTQRACTIGKEMGCKYAACMVTLDKDPKVASRLVRIYIENGFEIWEVNTGFNVVLKKDL